MNNAINKNATEASSKAGSAKLTQPLFTDKFTPESTAAKEMLYRQMLDGGYDLYELRIEAHIMGYSHQAPFDQWEHLN